MKRVRKNVLCSQKQSILHITIPEMHHNNVPE